MSMNRRDFVSATLKAAALGATWFEAPKILSAAGLRDDSSKQFGGFPMGLQTYSLRAFSFDDAAAKVEELGLHWVELFRAHYAPTTDPKIVAAMNAKLVKHKLRISAHGVQAFTANHEANEEFFKFAKAAGFRNISADPTPDSFDSLDKLVAKYDIRIAIHNHGPGARYDSAEQTKKAVQGHDKRIGFCADLGHFIRSGEDAVKVVHLLGDRLYGIHLKDFAEPKKDAKGVILGKGHLDVVGVFQALKKVNFPADGALSLEYEENEKNPMDDIKECLHIAAEGAMKAARS